VSLLAVSEDQGSRYTSESWCGPTASRGGWNPSTRESRFYSFWDSLTLSAGSPLCRSLVALLGVRREFGSLAVRAGGDVEAHEEKALEGRKLEKGTTAGPGQLGSVQNGLTEGRKLRSR
jgi:hypothetical protein